MKEGASVPSNGINGDAMKHREKAEDVTDETTTANNGNHNDTTTAPTEESQAPPPPLASIRDLFSFADTWEIKLCIAASFCCAVVTGAVYPAMTFFFANAFSDLSGDTSTDSFMRTIRKLTYTFLILGVIVLTSMTTQVCLMEKAASTMTKNLKVAWFKALLRQDIAYYDIMDVSGEATIITANANKYRKGVGRKLSEGMQFFTMFIGGFAYAFWASWQISLAVIGIAPFMTISTLFLVKMNTSVTSRANASYAQAGAIVSASITNIRTVLALNAVEIMIAKFQQKTKLAFDSAVSQVAIFGAANGFVLVSMLLSYVIVTLFGGWLLYDQVQENGCDPSDAVDGNASCKPSGTGIFGALMGITFSAAVIPQVSVAIESFVGARAACYPALVVIRRSLDTSEEEHAAASEQALRRGGSHLPSYKIDSSSESGKKLGEVRGEIEFRNVCFHYPTRQEIEVFRDFSLRIEAGKTVALVGASGGGKSTVVSLLERFYDPTAGSILLDGVDLRELNVKWLRQQIGLVSQEPKLFEMSIRDNIGAGNLNATDKEIEAAARMANAHDFVVSLPKGYDTDAGALGSQLSGGQKQRICIARCLVKKPTILLLDEATSALDTESERYVQDALDELMKLKGMTTVVIAHRLSTIKNADMICVVQDGRVVESGTHDELLVKESYYFKLVEAQRRSASCATAETSENSSETGDSSEHESAPESETGIPFDVDGGDDILIEFDDVHFEYPSRPDIPVLRGLNLQVKRGETLALVGPSGCGKSTVVQLIECFYRPSKGVIKFNGDDMVKLNVRWLRDQIGLVSQEPTLFDATIEDNIRFSVPNATHEQVIKAAKQANAHDFIMEFPEGYNTSVGEGSTLISGGQKQRIAIARALLKTPSVLLLDEATSALDSKSEKVVQEALDTIMADRSQTCVVIAHRLSTIQGADRIAVFKHGHIREIGTHNELMARPDGIYRHLQTLQSLATSKGDEALSRKFLEDGEATKSSSTGIEVVKENEAESEIDKKTQAENAKRARLLASGDAFYLIAGGVGALFASVVFPGWGFVFAYMTELLYMPVFPCTAESVPFGFSDCDDYWNYVADDMREKSFKIFYGFLGILASTMAGFTVMFWGFGNATERMNKRVRDAAFANILRQEVAWFDLQSPGALTSRLSDDAAMIHSFAGEPIRTLVASLASVVLGVVVSFVYMWPFALLILAILPFMAFGAETEMKMYYGEDEVDEKHAGPNCPGGIVIESLSNIRTIASLTLESARVDTYIHALERENPHPLRTLIVKGGTSGLGQFLQMWGMGLMFWWGGWLLYNYPDTYSYRNYLISMFSMMFCLYGLTLATEGTVDREKAKRAAARIFELTDRKSLIDPLATEGYFEV